MPYKDPEKRKAQARASLEKWRRENPERFREVRLAASRRQYAKHRDKCRAKSLAYYYRNRERENARSCARQKRLRAERNAALAGGTPTPVCDICQTVTRTVFDHDHSTTLFRGWLCDRCNRTLGQVKDDVQLLARMIDYLERSRLPKADCA